METVYMLFMYNPAFSLIHGLFYIIYIYILPTHGFTPHSTSPLRLLEGCFLQGDLLLGFGHFRLRCCDLLLLGLQRGLWSCEAARL